MTDSRNSEDGKNVPNTSTPEESNMSPVPQMDRQHSRTQIEQMGEVDLLVGSDLDRRKIIHSGMKDKRVLNAYRDLRTTLLQKAHGKNFICMVSSLTAAGGASYTATNLAAAFAFDRSKTSLLIDCNLYSPSTDTLLYVGDSIGVTDFIDDPEIDIKDIIYASGIPRLRVVPVGSNREAGAEHYSSAKMARFIKAIRERYDDRFIFVDAPDVGAAETRILADLCDITLLIVPYGKASPKQIQEGISAIPEDKLAGILFNN